MKGNRTIAVVTGTRAEFGLLLPVMRAIRAHRSLTLCTVVTGTHLTTGSWRDVVAAGIPIDHRVAMQKKGVSGRAADVAALGRGVTGLGKVFSAMRPDVVLVLGDRIEALAAALAASVGGVRLAHIHGGDRAEGVADEAMRHAVSKLAHLHFPATAQSRRRLARMGESPHWIFNVGSPAMDGLDAVKPDPAAAQPYIIVMQHPIGAGEADEARWMRATLAAIPRATEKVVLAPNSDPGREGIRAALSDVNVVDHLPRPRFLSLLKGARAIVGNSSAGLIEAAALRVPCVNVGPRQAGREKPANVIDCDYGKIHVQRALKQASSLDLRRMKHPYGDGKTGRRIASLLGSVDLAQLPPRKRNTY